MKPQNQNHDDPNVSRLDGTTSQQPSGFDPNQTNEESQIVQPNPINSSQQPQAQPANNTNPPESTQPNPPTTSDAQLVQPSQQTATPQSTANTEPVVQPLEPQNAQPASLEPTYQQQPATEQTSATYTTEPTEQVPSPSSSMPPQQPGQHVQPQTIQPNTPTNPQTAPQTDNIHMPPDSYTASNSSSQSVANPPANSAVGQPHSSDSPNDYRLRDGLRDTFIGIKHNLGAFIGFNFIFYLSLVPVSIVLIVLAMVFAFSPLAIDDGLLGALLFPVSGFLLLNIFTFLTAYFARMVGKQILVGVIKYEQSDVTLKSSLMKIFLVILLLQFLVAIPLFLYMLAILSSQVLGIFGILLGIILFILSLVNFIFIYLHFAPLPFIFLLRKDISIRKLFENARTIRKTNKHIRNYLGLHMLFLLGANFVISLFFGPILIFFGPLLTFVEGAASIIGLVLLPIYLAVALLAPIISMGPIMLLAYRYREKYTQ